MAKSNTVIKDVAQAVHEELQDNAQGDEKAEKALPSAAKTKEIVEAAFRKAGVRINQGDYRASEVLAAMESAGQN